MIGTHGLLADHREHRSRIFTTKTPQDPMGMGLLESPPEKPLCRPVGAAFTQEAWINEPLRWCLGVLLVQTEMFGLLPGPRGHNDATCHCASDDSRRVAMNSSEPSALLRGVRILIPQKYWGRNPRAGARGRLAWPGTVGQRGLVGSSQRNVLYMTTCRSLRPADRLTPTHVTAATGTVQIGRKTR